MTSRLEVLRRRSVGRLRNAGEGTGTTLHRHYLLPGIAYGAGIAVDLDELGLLEDFGGVGEDGGGEAHFTGDDGTVGEGSATFKDEGGGVDEERGP